MPRMTKAQAAALMGIPVDASEEEIKKAYRRGALLYHPDKSELPKDQAGAFLGRRGGGRPIPNAPPISTLPPTLFPSPPSPTPQRQSSRSSPPRTTS